MVATVNASTTAGVVITPDNSGVLALQSSSATALTIDASQNVTLVGTLTTTGITNSGVATATRFNPTGSSVTGNGMYLPAANSLGLSTNGTNAVYINSSQNVGIGTASPASKLEIVDASANSLRISGAGDHAFGFTGYSGNAATQVFSIRNDGINNCYINTQSSCPLNFGVSTGTTFGSTTSQMQIISTGQVGININPSAGNSFKVNAIGSDNSVQFGTTGAGVYLTNGGTSFSTYSDTRLKNITGRYKTPLADVAKLEAIKFTWKNDTGNKPCVGVSAQSVEAVIPEAVDRGTNFNAEGDTTEYLSVKYTELIPLMIASIQELKAINDTLTARIVALENR